MCEGEFLRSAVLCFAILVACGKKDKEPVPPPTADTLVPQPAEKYASRPPEVEELWNRALSMDQDDLARLAGREGATGLVERAGEPARKKTAILALAYVASMEGLPFLAEVAANGSEEEAAMALSSAAAFVARPRRAEDAEDALEVRVGCDRLLGLVANQGRERRRRARALRVIRMLAERGCQRNFPAELDAPP